MSNAFDQSKDYYETLEINRNATDEDVKKAYQRLALKFHPDRKEGGGDSQKFSDVGEAFDVLSDPPKKAIYDKFGQEGLKEGVPVEPGFNGAWTSKYAYHGDPEKTFRQFFGDDNLFASIYSINAPLRYGGMRPGLVKPQDPPIERDLLVSLDDLFYGCTRTIRITRKVMNDDGLTYSIKDKILTIDIKRGWKEGIRIIFSKEGDQGPNIVPADIVFTLRQKSHPLFERQHNDLIYKTKISLEKALTGFPLDVPTLDGKLIGIYVYDIVHPAYKKIVTGEGMPLSQDPSQRGNIIITFEILFPETLCAERKHLIKQALKC
ncbi:dnaJ homolog subfamily B member 13 [Cololabis saira]|uniref:dnaJ homolog subfamily B member 13 n=1 Tax=Cololabis saira TaxID=129043 RepID=UPI002AD424ED|nr:dnaJ homolog subfamily B member 13 [Cololabis saira]